MKLALAWLLCLLCAAGYLGERWHQGISLRSDLLALLPDADRDPVVNAAKAHLAGLLGRRVVVLVGDSDRDTARRAGAALAERLRQSGLATDIVDNIPADALRRQGAILFAHRSGLLSTEDRATLEANHGDQIVARALATVFSPIALFDSSLLRQDPFLLFPAYLAALPSPVPRVQLDDGMPTIRDKGKTYVVLTFNVVGNVDDSPVQRDFIRSFDSAVTFLRSQTPSVDVLRLGSIFYFAAEARSAQLQTIAISIVSLLGTIALILVVFRAFRPLLLLALAIGSGLLCALSVSLWSLGTLHVVTLTFGASLIGIAIDYCLQYLVTGLDSGMATPRERLRRVLPAIFFGFLTTMIGYSTLMATPFPGLREIALFSAVGLAGSFVTLLVWFPLVDGPGIRRLSPINIAKVTEAIWSLWEAPQHRPIRLGLLALGLAVIVIGAARFRFDDDIRRYQGLPANLQTQETAIRQLTGLVGGSQFLLLRGQSDDAVLQTEEQVMPTLDRGVGEGWLAGYQAIARIVPSAARQAENRQLVQDRLVAPFLRAYAQQAGLGAMTAMPAQDASPLLLSDIPDGLPLSYVRQLVLPATGGGAAHVILLNGASDFAQLANAVSSFASVTAIDPIGDIIHVLADYRRRALILLGLSAMLMWPVLAWRYGLRGCWRVFAPPLASVVATAATLAAFGLPFTFFTAMALVLVLSIGFDYAIFCREAAAEQKQVAMTGIVLAMVTTLLSFGLLGLSNIFALKSFGLALFIGTIVAFLLSPLARPKGSR